MRSSYSILFLGLWLTGQCWVSGSEQSYPKPSISVHPSETVAPGGSVDIHCKSEGYTRMDFYLQKQISSNFEMLKNEVADNDEVVFPIVNATPSDAGMYRCIYCYKAYTCQAWSYYSDSVNISVRVIQPVGNYYVRLGAAGLVLLALVLIVAEAMYSWRKEHL